MASRAKRPRGTGGGKPDRPARRAATVIELSWLLVRMSQDLVAETMRTYTEIAVRASDGARRLAQIRSAAELMRTQAELAQAIGSDSIARFRDIARRASGMADEIGQQLGKPPPRKPPAR